MRRYDLERNGPEDAPRYREIHAYDEVVHPVWKEGVWRVSCRGEVCLRVLTRRYDFHLVATVEEPDPGATPEALAVARRKAHARSVCDPVTTPAESAEWEAWLELHEDEEPVRRNGWAAAEVLRAPMKLQDLADIAEVCVELAAGKRPFVVGIILVVTGWTEHEADAVRAALDTAAELGGKSSVVLVQNDPEAHRATRAWKAPASGRRLLRRVCVPNEGYAAACGAGAKALGEGVPWLLFSQADAVFTATAVRQAAALAEVLATDEARSPIVGPSGGFVREIENGVVEEWGRNARQAGQAPLPVDFVAGYWVLVAADVYRDAEGWDPGYFLYFEDPDLAFRCACVGARAIAWPALPVEHHRGSTIRARFPREVVEAIQRTSRVRFARIWGPRRVLGVAS